MIEITNENVLFCDVDGTLISKINMNSPLSVADALSSIVYPVAFDNYGITQYYYPYHEHIDLLKRNKNRGQYIVVWSQNGYKWCKEVITKLQLTDYVDMIITKPHLYVDDLDVNKWAFRLFLGEDK